MKEIVHELISPYLSAIYKVLFAYVIVLLAVIADLWSGISKSKAKGIYTHTYGLDRTLDKLRKRYNLLLAFSLVDSLIIISDINPSNIPYATIGAAIIMCLVEIKSIFEKDEDKGRYKEAAKTAAELWKGINKEELADIIINKMEEKKNENK
ncbi:hypothetical protein [Dysgonomonas macrotermitis]|uniref:Bacteriophage holin family protein n=1 Tax=Dysgonomonas macrotermitis TaxID=1346286 RepID=A0A1M4UHZ1_9BACT|nr:hypothetical protein [Dysgonomonas macrotermitis]SHE56381.1 hypothetical protein SAMN05444362_101610 [Dysgonomonas macrotermitis]